MSKRKAESYRKNQRREWAPPEPTELDPALFIQAHEADIVRGPRGHAAALALEVGVVGEQIVPGEGLIQWKGATDAPPQYLGEDEEIEVNRGEQKAVWVDRYDARLLLDALPTFTGPSTVDHISPTGWSDLPSDAEDTFFLSPSEIEDYERDKRRRAIEQGREARLRALHESEGDPDRAPEDEWGGSDEEPDDAQKELMHRTASHVLTSPNPAQLEMRILANHGADPRFAFLRGRWARAWRLEKGRVRVQHEEERNEEEAGKGKGKVGLGRLTGYGDSDEESESEVEGAKVEEETKAGSVAAEFGHASVAQTDDESIKEARRARAREWAEKRRAKAAEDPGDSDDK